MISEYNKLCFHYLNEAQYYVNQYQEIDMYDAIFEAKSADVEAKIINNDKSNSSAFASLKKAAQAVGEKNIEMVKSKDLLALTGYIHGGCSPIGMKKFFTTTIDKTATNFATIIFSAGKIGYQVELGIEDLKKAIRFNLAEITVE